jgi:hypothetical protein
VVGDSEFMLSSASVILPAGAALTPAVAILFDSQCAGFAHSGTSPIDRELSDMVAR